MFRYAHKRKQQNPLHGSKFLWVKILFYTNLHALLCGKKERAKIDNYLWLSVCVLTLSLFVFSHSFSLILSLSHFLFFALAYILISRSAIKLSRVHSSYAKPFVRNWNFRLVLIWFISSQVLASNMSNMYAHTQSAIKVDCSIEFN